MTDARPSVTPPVALAFGTIGFFALLIAGFGMLSLLTGAEVVAVPGLGPLPGAFAVAFAVIAFVLATWAVVRRPEPGYGGVVLVVVATFLAYLLGLLVGAMFGGIDLARALAAAGAFATSWFAVVLASTALIAGWTAVALVRTRAGRPRWPWEDRSD